MNVEGIQLCMLQFTIDGKVGEVKGKNRVKWYSMILCAWRVVMCLITVHSLVLLLHYIILPTLVIVSFTRNDIISQFQDR